MRLFVYVTRSMSACIALHLFMRLNKIQIMFRLFLLSLQLIPFLFVPYLYVGTLRGFYCRLGIYFGYDSGQTQYLLLCRAFIYSILFKLLMLLVIQISLLLCFRLKACCYRHMWWYRLSALSLSVVSFQFQTQYIRRLPDLVGQRLFISAYQRVFHYMLLSGLYPIDRDWCQWSIAYEEQSSHFSNVIKIF